MKKKTAVKQTEKKVKFKTFGYSIWIIVTNDIIASRGKIDDKIGHSLEDDSPESITGLHSHKDGAFECFVFLKPNKNSINTICHECFHAITWLFNSIDAEPEEEIFAYHLGFLAQKSMNEIAKYKSKF
jgi:hypothetical protein